MSTPTADIERLVEAVRLQIDYPTPYSRSTYINAVAALDLLARLARGDTLTVDAEGGAEA